MRIVENNATERHTQEHSSFECYPVVLHVMWFCEHPSQRPWPLDTSCGATV